MPLIWTHVLRDYQKERIKTFVNPSADPRGKGWNIIQAMTALGSGQLAGKGWGRGTQTNFRFLPEYQTDFIFPTVGEQFGMVGCSVVLLLMLLLVLRMVHLARLTEDPFGVLIITGLATMFCTHIILNVGMTVGLLPVTGLPLPFFSYGGTFMITCLVSVGLALGIGARRGL
jgi:rod shape determining protein RodA